MYRTTIYRLRIECQPERGIEWIYPANAFCIHRNYIIEAIEDVHRTRRHCRARESKYVVYSYPRRVCVSTMYV